MLVVLFPRSVVLGVQVGKGVAQLLIPSMKMKRRYQERYPPEDLVSVERIPVEVKIKEVLMDLERGVVAEVVMVEDQEVEVEEEDVGVEEQDVEADR